MNNYLVILKTEQNAVHILNIKAHNFCEAEKQALLFPTITGIIQITLYN